jgi:hypothetical protein
MARHNRDGEGTDQHGSRYIISYQPDWLRQIKISRTLSGSSRQSTKTLFRNPAVCAERSPGDRVRTRVTSKDGKGDVIFTIDGSLPKRGDLGKARRGRRRGR